MSGSKWSFFVEHRDGKEQLFVRKQTDPIEIHIYQTLGPRLFLLEWLLSHQNPSHLFLQYDPLSQTLIDWCRSDPTKARRKHIILQLIDAIEHIHANGIAVCDLKPDNILILPGDIVKIIDFDRSFDSKVPSQCATTAPYTEPSFLFSPLQERYEKMMRRPTSADRFQRQDLYVLGLIIIMIWNHRLMYSDRGGKDAYDYGMDSYQRFRQQYVREYKQIVQHMDTILQQLYQDPEFVRQIDMYRLLRKFPDERRLIRERAQTPDQAQRNYLVNVSHNSVTTIDRCTDDAYESLARFTDFIMEKLDAPISKDDRDKIYEHLHDAILKSSQCPELVHKFLIVFLIAKRILLGSAAQKARQKQRILASMGQKTLMQHVYGMSKQRHLLGSLLRRILPSTSRLSEQIDQKFKHLQRRLANDTPHIV